MLKKTIVCGVLLIGFAAATEAQNESHARNISPADLPTSNLISAPGPSFVAPHVSKQTTIVAYGDQRFTDPANTTATNPKARRWLVQRIAGEKPDAVLLNGDVPLNGADLNDYQVYETETQPWRNEHLNVYPALGNHEFHGDPQ